MATTKLKVERGPAGLTCSEDDGHVIVSDLVPGDQYSLAGGRIGDRIVAVGHQRVRTPKEAIALFEAHSAFPLLVDVSRTPAALWPSSPLGCRLVVIFFFSLVVTGLVALGLDAAGFIVLDTPDAATPREPRAIQRSEAEERKGVAAQQKFVESIARVSAQKTGSTRRACYAPPLRDPSCTDSAFDGRRRQSDAKLLYMVLFSFEVDMLEARCHPRTNA